MKKTISIISLLLIISISVSAQKYVTKNGNISFYSKTPIENIDAHNKQVNAALNSKTGEFVFKVLIKSFEFEKALMQEHFNENYMESDKFPNSTFDGQMFNVENINFSKNGTHEIKVKGMLSIHGISQEVEEKGTIIIRNGEVRAKAMFSVLLKDYDIKVPKAVTKNIAERIDIDVDVLMKAL